MKELPINLADLELAFERPRELQMDVFLDLDTGELVELSRDPGVFGDDVAEEEAPIRQKVEAQPERFEDVPTLSTHEAFQLMERFADGQPDEDRREFQRALQGKGAFGRFRDAVARARKDDEWHRFREQQLDSIIRRWLEGLGVIAPPRAQKPQQIAAPVAPAPVLPGLVQMLIFGGKPELRGERVERVLDAPTPDVARRYFTSVARSICAHIGEDWRKRFVENTNLFERERFVLRVDGKRVLLMVTVDPAVVKLFG